MWIVRHSYGEDLFLPSSKSELVFSCEVCVTTGLFNLVCITFMNNMSIWSWPMRSNGAMEHGYYWQGFRKYKNVGVNGNVILINSKKSLKISTKELAYLKIWLVRCTCRVALCSWATVIMTIVSTVVKFAEESFQIQFLKYYNYFLLWTQVYFFF